MKIAIIGLGHIGSSLALNLRNTGFADYIYGYDHHSHAMEYASRTNLIDEQVQLEVAAGIADLLIVAIPVDKIKETLPTILDYALDKSVITDVGSTKATICAVADMHEKRENFVAGHPIAGRELSGPNSAVLGLFSNKTTIIVDREKSDPQKIRIVEEMYRSLDMEILYMGAEEHDIHLAYISHVSHISSFSLALSVLKAEKDEQRIFQFAGSGFDSTARLAKSSPHMWAPIFLDNKEPLIKVLDQYIDILHEFRYNIVNNRSEALVASMTEANEIRRILEGNFQPSQNNKKQESTITS